MEPLDLLSKENLNSEYISLEFSQIANLGPLLPKLGQFKRLKELSLHGNRLKALPEDLAALASLELLDLSNNLFKDPQSVAGLRTLPKLRSLIIDVRGQEDEDAIVRMLPRLEELNAKPVKAPSINSRNGIGSENALDNRHGEFASFEPQEKQSNEEGDLGIKRDDLDAVGLLYQCIKELFHEHSPNADESLLEQFDEHVSHVLQDLSTKLSETQLTAIKTIQAKYALYEICFIKIIELIAQLDPRLSSILEGLHDAHAIIFKDIANNVTSSSGSIAYQQKKEQQPEGEGLDTAELLEAAENLEKENNKLRADKEEMIEAHKQEREELLEQIASLQEENAKYLDTIVQRSKENADQNLGKLATSPSQDLNGNKAESVHQAGYESFAGSAAGNVQQQTLRPNHNMMNPTNVYIGQVAIRALTLKQLKDVIEEIYASKAKYDQRCLEAKLPRETMEQHMYTYLNQKYGLKNLIIEWATAIINGIKKFSNEDNDVAVFGRILRNECDEDFRLVQSQVKVTIGELLKMYLRSKYPLKNNAEIKEMLASRMNDSIQEDECVDIINYMYNEEDSQALLTKLKRHYTYPSKTADTKRLSREEQLKLAGEKERPVIEFNIFQKVILDFQLKSHEKFLKNFVSLFRSIDKDMNGIIDESEFRKMVLQMEKYNIQPDIDKLLVTVDPYNHQQITFSQSVSLFSAEMISDGENTYSILQKISLDI